MRCLVGVRDRPRSEPGSSERFSRSLSPEAAMRTDQDIQEDVELELQWDPDLDAIDIAVSVKDGVVTLAGFVKNLNDKFEAESAAKPIAGVRAVANDLDLLFPAIHEQPPPHIP